ncbi:MmgE/PrpD family protein [Paraburkholderia caffeinilytica]|uniref:MmgE/PrpD family protein n=1 Tax=Paraburkholderia caffeinilytica TaxID=1761016 RepID=UPI0038B9B9C2
MTGSKLPLLNNATRDLATFAALLQYEDLPRSVIERIKTSLLDSIGCCLYGLTLPWTQRVLAMVDEDGGKPVASLWRTGRRTSISNAVLVNCTAGHAFELDDIHKESILHPGSIAIPTALAFADRAGKVSGREAITAMASGYEVGTRVGNAATMSLFFRGFHPQGTSGAFVSAATAGRALRLDATAMQHALGIVGSQAGGLMAAQEGAMVKRFHAGRAAQSGVYSALLAKQGFTGIVDVLEAPYGGYLSTYSDAPNAARLTDGLGTEWETAKIGYKPHAAVTSIHAALDALTYIMQSNGLHANDIMHVDVGVSAMTHVHCAWPYRAQGVTAAQMNLYYGLAVTAIDGVAFVAQYHEGRLADPRILDFIARIDACIDPQIEALGPAFRHAARVSVMTRGGITLTHEIMNRRGSNENPISPREIEIKFQALTESCLSPRDIAQIIYLCERFDELDDISELLALLAAPRLH